MGGGEEAATPTPLGRNEQRPARSGEGAARGEGGEKPWLAQSRSSAVQAALLPGFHLHLGIFGMFIWVFGLLRPDYYFFKESKSEKKKK